MDEAPPRLPRRRRPCCLSGPWLLQRRPPATAGLPGRARRPGRRRPEAEAARGSGGRRVPRSNRWAGARGPSSGRADAIDVAAGRGPRASHFWRSGGLGSGRPRRLSRARAGSGYVGRSEPHVSSLTHIAGRALGACAAARRAAGWRHWRPAVPHCRADPPPPPPPPASRPLFRRGSAGFSGCVAMPGGRSLIDRGRPILRAGRPGLRNLLEKMDFRLV